MNDSAVAKRYARALFDIAKEKNELDRFEQDLNLVEQTIRESDEFKSFVLHPGIDVKVKKEKFEHIYSGHIAPEVLSLLELLLDRRRGDAFVGLAKEFTALANEARNLVDATVYTVAPLDENELATIAGQFGNSIGKKVRISNQADPSIIGGLVIRIGDMLYDGSVSGKLARFKRTYIHS